MRWECIGCGRTRSEHLLPATPALRSVGLPEQEGAQEGAPVGRRVAGSRTPTFGTGVKGSVTAWIIILCALTLFLFICEMQALRVLTGLFQKDLPIRITSCLHVLR